MKNIEKAVEELVGKKMEGDIEIKTAEIIQVKILINDEKEMTINV